MDEQETEMMAELTKAEKAIRRRFVDQYLSDYDPLAAAVRLGYSASYAEQYSKMFMAEPFTLNLIAKREKELGLDTEEKKHRHKIVTGLYREAHSRFNTGSARVAAFTQLAKITGIEAPVKVQKELHLTDSDPLLDELSTEDLELVRSKLYGSTSPNTH